MRSKRRSGLAVRGREGAESDKKERARSDVEDWELDYLRSVGFRSVLWDYWSV